MERDFAQDSGLWTGHKGERAQEPSTSLGERFWKAGVGSFLMIETFRDVCVAKEQYRKFLIFQVRRQVPGEVPLGRPEPVGQQSAACPENPGLRSGPFPSCSASPEPLGA